MPHGDKGNSCAKWETAFFGKFRSFYVFKKCLDGV